MPLGKSSLDPLGAGLQLPRLPDNLERLDELVGASFFSDELPRGT